VTPDRLARAVVRLRDRDAQQRLTDLVAHLRRSRPLERIVGKQRHEFHVIAVEVVEAFVAEQELVFALTSNGRFLVEKTLRELEASLDAHRFARSIGARLLTWQG
jgi:DNA-binding LytR/AlgR family response regulator